MKHSWKKIHIEGKDTISQCKVCNLLRISRTIQVERGWKNMIHKVEYIHFGENQSKAGECNIEKSRAERVFDKYWEEDK